MPGRQCVPSLARLASPPKAAAEALKELGVSVSDAGGKMRPMEDVLADLYKATRKYGEVDRVSFFKGHCREKRLSHRLWRSLMQRVTVPYPN
ncbi:tail protein (modular protein) [Escherichia coli]|uniref:Tail protein (Modular protein) n=1 Tax=Escherichia coli TaxID=562 RepID=A0A376J4A1_ECOLX|nr:tail protein (modular protein) [Escherichia coli]